MGGHGQNLKSQKVIGKFTTMAGSFWITLLHQKGYQWGSQHQVSDPKDCLGTSEEFIEGCLAFAGVEGPLGERDFDVSFPHMSGIN